MYLCTIYIAYPSRERGPAPTASSGSPRSEQKEHETTAYYLSNHGRLICQTMVPLQVYYVSIIVYYGPLQSVTVHYSFITVHYT